MTLKRIEEIYCPECPATTCPKGCVEHLLKAHNAVIRDIFRDIEAKMIRGKRIDSFWAKVRVLKNECWQWQGSKNQLGYGQFWGGGKLVSAHRFAYELLLGKIPPDRQLDHLCRNTSCVNPAHLEIVTGSENVKRGLLPNIMRQRQLNKTHCPQGHPYDEQNTYLRPDKLGRECKACRKETKKRREVRYATL